VRRRPVLYIAGSDDDRVQFTRIARRWGTVKLVVAHGGREGLRLAADRRLSLVVLDASPADLDGRELVVALRQRALTLDAPVVVLADTDVPSERARFIWAGASAYLTKPLDVAELDRTVGMLLQIAAAR